jgi:hypothetical protein
MSVQLGDLRQVMREQARRADCGPSWPRLEWSGSTLSRATTGIIRARRGLRTQLFNLKGGSDRDAGPGVRQVDLKISAEGHSHYLTCGNSHQAPITLTST